MRTQQMMNRIHFLAALFACLGAAATSYGAPQRTGDLRPQHTETPPAWSVGNWSGRNDYRHSDVELQIGDDGRLMITFRVGTNNQTKRGTFRSGRLDFDGDKYAIRRDGDDLVLTKDNERRDNAVLHKVGRSGNGRNELTIDEPRNGSRVKSGRVAFEGSSTFRDVQIEVYRGNDRVYSNTASARGGHFEASTNLVPGSYQATFRGRDSGRNGVERRVAFTVGGIGRTVIDEPRAGARYDSGTININGTSEAPEVEIEIDRGRDRVFIEQVSVRNGRFNSKTALSWGDYVVTVRGKENGSTVGTDKRGFHIIGAEDSGPTFELRLNRPSNRARLTSNSVEFEGASNGSDVRIEIFKARARVYNQLIVVRDGRFRTRVELANGHYDVTVTVEGRGRGRIQRKISFDVDR